jgi:hypothetical protein
MARFRLSIFAAFFALLMSTADFSFAGEPAHSPVRLAMPETVAIGADDTLELTLQTPKLPNDGTATPPEVSVFVVSGAETPPPSGRALVSPSPRAGEWLVHVRGLKAPDGKAGVCDLLLKWKFASDPKLGGEVRLAKALDFKAEAADVVLLMDGSLSLGLSDPRRLRVEAAREFIANARNTGSIGRIGIVQFDNNSRTLVGLTPLDNSFENALEKLDERGQTDIDGGIRHALKLLQSAQQNGATAAGASIILFTDGKQEPGVYRNAHEEATKAGVAVHTLALGRDADRTLLKRIAAETGGTFADAQKDKDLGLAYAAIASRIARSRTISSAPLPADGKVAVPADGACRSLAISIGGETAGVLSITTPGGKSWQSPQQLHPEYFVEQPDAGAWIASFPPLNKGGPGGVSVTASARTALYPVVFRSDPQTRAPHELDTDEPFLAVSLCEGADALAATVNVSLTLGEGNAARTLTAQLFDDGQHNDGAAGDGIFANYLPPWAEGAGAYPESASGTLKIVASGKRDGADFRRETEAIVLTKRHDGPALIASGPVDLGTHFSGEDIGGELSLRVRGGGGTLSITPAAGELTPILQNPPASMKARERATVKFRVALPELALPGEYSGALECKLEGAEMIRVPWRVKVAQPTLAAPEAIDLGELQPGDKVPIQLQVKTNGGRLSICSAEIASVKNWISAQYPLQLTRRAPLLLSCTPEVADLDLDFDLAIDAPAGHIQRTLVLRDFAGREAARVALTARVKPQSLAIDTSLAFGRVEPGEVLAREIRWKWEQAGLRAPVNAIVKLLPDVAAGNALNTIMSPAQLKDGQAASEFSLKLASDAKPGEIGGWISFESGPVLTLRRWSATVVQPRLVIDVTKLDFGTLIQGQKRTLKIGLKADGARPIEAKLAPAPEMPKVRLPHIKLPADALKYSHDHAALTTEVVTTMAPGTTQTLNVQLEIPDNAQDGFYQAPLTLTSRLGTVTIPASITVINEIEPAAFHVTPITLPLRFDIKAKMPRDSVAITSHRDDPIALKMELKPVPSLDGTMPTGPLPALFVVTNLADGDESHQSLTLAGRDTIDVFVQAHPDAQAGQRCRLHITGRGEEHVVEILIERNGPSHFSSGDSGSGSGAPRVLDWLIFGLILLAAIGAFTVHRLVKRAWVRYAFYSVLFHLAFLPWAMPRNSLLEALPDSVQISLLESEDSLGGALSEQQMRRLEALKTGGGADEKVTLAQGEGFAGVKANEKVPDLAAKDVERAGTPGASALDAAKAVEERREVAGGPTLRAPAAPGTEAPLSSEALSPNPAPAAAPAPKPAPVVARSVNPAANNEPLPAAITAPETRAAAPSSDTALPSSLSAEPNPVRTVLANEAAARVLPNQPAADAPLEVAALSPDAKSAPPSAAVVPSAIARSAPMAAPGTAGSPKLSVPIPAAGGRDVDGGSAAGKAARSDDLALSRDVASDPVGAPGGGDSATAKRSAGGVNTGAIDDPLDAGVLLGGVSPNGKGDQATGGRATGNAGAGSGGADPNSPRGGTALGAIGNGTGGGEVAFAAGLDSGTGRGNSSGAGRGAGSALPGFNVGNDVGGGQPGLPGGGNGTGRRPGGAGTGVDDDAPLSAGPIAGGNGVGNGAGAGKPGLPNGTGEGAGQIARGGSALKNGFSTNGTGTELALAGAERKGGTPGFAGGGAASSLTRGGMGDPASGLGALSAPGATRKIGAAGLGGDGDAPLSAGPVAGGIGTGGKGTGAAEIGNAGGIPGGVGATLARGGTALGSGIAPGGNGADLALLGPAQRGVPGGGGGSLKDLPHVGVSSPTRSGLGGNNGTATRPSVGTAPGETDKALVADQIGNGKAPVGNGVGNAPGVNTGKADPGRVAAAGLGRGGIGNGNGGTGNGGTGSLAGLGGAGSGLAGLGEKIASGGAGPGRKNGVLNAGPNSQQLEDAGGGKLKGQHAGTLPNWRVVGEAHTGGLVRLNMGLAKHAGDWNSSPTALHHLRAAFIERSGLPEIEVNVLTLDLTNLKQLAQTRMIMITSNQPIAFKPEELKTMGDYIRSGGTIWVNDSSASDFEGFDKGFRPVVSQIVENGELVSLPLDHPFFKACYDLSKGYKGFRVPPGDKYRQDYIEGVMVPDEQAAAKGVQALRAGIIYTRNDYADGLEIDPRMNAGMKSLTDLTNAEMQEASLRFGMNLLAYSMGSSAPKLPPPPENTAQFEKLYRYNGPPLAALDDFTVAQDQYNKQIWNVEKEWCNETQMWLLDDKNEKTKVISLRFTGGEKFKAAITRQLATDLSTAEALVFDLQSDLKSGCNIALLFNTKDGKAYECRPVFARPGWNRGLRFPLALGDMKSSHSKVPWKDYDTPFEPRNQVERITLLIYNLNESGAVKMGPIRVETKK